MFHSTWRVSGYVFRACFQGNGLTLLSDSQQKVLTNKDLDLPTQQELLAQFRCDEISASVLEAFQDAFKGVRKPIESGSVLDGLGGMMNDWRTTALSAFFLFSWFTLGN